MSDLTNRLRGLYRVGLNGEYGMRDFSDFIPPISKEAADRIDELEEAITKLLLIADENQNDRETVYAVYEISRKVLNNTSGE